MLELNPDVNAFQRKFVNEVRRCDEMERKLRFLEGEISRDNISFDAGENPEAPQPKEIVDMEATFERLEKELREVNANAVALKKNFLELTELKYILRKTQGFFDEVRLREGPERRFFSRQELFEQYEGSNEVEEVAKSVLQAEAGAPNSQQGPLGFVAGVVLRDRMAGFERMLWRACRGNVFLHTAEIETPLNDPITGDEVHKCAFVIFYQGDQLKTRVRKICEGYRATLYPCPEGAAERREMAMGVLTRIEDLKMVLSQTQDHRHRVLVAAAKNLHNWWVKVRKIKATYHTLNLFNLDVTNKCLIAEGWIPAPDLETVQLALRRGDEQSGSSVPPIVNCMETKENPPTYNRTDQYTQAFQNLVDAYGVAAYREVNPAPYTIITFPFLFAVMFGDAGHGVIMALFAFWMIWKEKSLQAQKSGNEIFSMFFGGRYLIFLMGLFSVYSGIIYNDIFSKSFNIFGTSFNANYSLSDLQGNKHFQLDPSRDDDYIGYPYPLGVDPAWGVSTNKISFINSYKMKNSIICGVIQMLFGVLLSVINHRYFKRPLNIWCEFIPQLVFMCCLFGYLVILVFHKWVFYSAKEAGCAPSILITLINMVLLKTPPACDKAVNPKCCDAFMFAGQGGNSHTSLSENGGADLVEKVEDSKRGGGHGHGHDEPFEFGEVFVHQAIHTIEYCLGTISHTASYLRLWALSLAHAQLSEVLWNMVFRIGLHASGYMGALMLIVVFAFWAVLTIGVLIVMEGLSAFLHCLRLHWVEFQSKFYLGTGEEMILCQFFLQSESAYACVSELGELGLVQFRDLNPDVNAFQRKFVNEVRRCDEMERKLRFLEREIRKDEIPILDTGENPEAPQPKEMIDMEATFERLENELREVNSNAEALKKNFLELTELKHILRKTQGFVAGVVARDRLPAFERMLWRACRGNVFLRTAEIETPLNDPISGDEVHKCVLLIFFQGEQLKTRVRKICEGFRATLYPCPETPAERREMAMGVMTRIEDLNTVLSQTQDHRHRVLVAAAKNLHNWWIKVRKIKAIYHTLNLFNLDVTHKCLIAEGWVPSLDLETIQLALRRGTEQSGSSVPPIVNRMDTKEDPPTYNRTNKFTQAFQNLVDAYGVATYREVNPAPYTIITFPFLFAVMFGDAGHGTIMALCGFWLIWKEKPLQAQKSSSEIFSMFFGGRYLIFLMGIFSVYTGLIYNDIFSKSLNIFGSSFQVNYNLSTLQGRKDFQLNPNSSSDDYAGYPYPFGMDPAWGISANKISFTNSYKMKNSIILGVIQMVFGVALSLVNHRYFKRPLNIWCEFIPQLVFMCSLFGYLIILVFHKWVFFSADQAGCAPSILITLINMVLLKTPPECNKDINPKCCDAYMFAGQNSLQKFLLGVNSHASLTEEGGTETEETGGGHGGGGHGEDEPFEFGEVLIHQAIHAIEYCLGTISHTASYLRLWALSLAHAQLSEVLWNMVLRIGLRASGYLGGIVLFAVFSFWAVLTVGILVIMEGLSAFLHCLRLHWVEFQSKFYQGTGYAFVPFSFEVILDQARASED
ncbi:unnamed protein product [Darwinula stevensoni]|uniref:V-type proton ATPase subunit a n=1 Tax=Darwinula stevensoni TaxID=69355 RepID=A0A7R8X6Q7_9CRUS|nr:unnamed protein product [Darwinula stevensoni]CAG0882372.1 unnamed protein product [Darwinula stevensoni]